MAKKTLIIALVVSLGINLGVLGIFLFHLLRGPEAEHPIAKILKQMKLTPEQRELMKEEHQNFEQQTQPIKDQLADKRSQVFDLLKESELNTEKRDQLFSEIAALQAELESQVFMHLSRVKQILTPDQQEMFFQHLETELPHDGGDHPPEAFHPEKPNPPPPPEGPPPEGPPQPPHQFGEDK
jgi:Spy/CpxP family protein refolding chaperone